MRLYQIEIVLALATLTGCATSLITGGAGSPATGYGSDNVLPRTASLIDSTEEVCRKNLQMGAQSPRVIVEPGETASFPITDPYITWYCVVDGIPHGKMTKCKDGTRFARVTRPSTGGSFLIECFK